MIERSKPAPDIFLEACRQLQAVPASAYGIEDSYNGIRALHAAGMHPIMVPDLLEPDTEMRQLAEVILPSLNEVISYIDCSD
jgi:beta-phosphoglucomutase-like phosphatase (HAD superfamily)